MRDFIESEWVGMPEFIQEKKEPFKKIKQEFLDGSYIFVRFERESDFSSYIWQKMKYNFCTFTANRSDFSKVTNQKITNKTKSIWYPYKAHRREVKKVYVYGS